MWSYHVNVQPTSFFFFFSFASAYGAPLWLFLQSLGSHEPTAPRPPQLARGFRV